MASNPLRPVYQGTIESTWGQSVADHVTRRYATTAARDADLNGAGLTPTDLEGQIVAITGAGRPTFLEMMVGGIWKGVLSGWDMQAASTHIGADVNANATIPFPRAFGGVPFVLWSDQSAGDAVNNAAIGMGCVVGVTAAHFIVRCQDVNAAPIISRGVQIAWIALYAGAVTLADDTVVDLADLPTIGGEPA